MRQKQTGKLPQGTESNQENAINIAGPFQNATNAKKYLLVSVGHYSGWPKAEIFRNLTTEKVLDFEMDTIAGHRKIPGNKNGLRNNLP